MSRPSCTRQGLPPRNIPTSIQFQCRWHAGAHVGDAALLRKCATYRQHPLRLSTMRTAAGYFSDTATALTARADPLVASLFAGIAQQVERRPCKAMAAGSIPAAGSNHHNPPPQQRQRLAPSAVVIFHEENGMNIGDIVRLKSGGPDMTVTGLTGSYGVHLAWFVAGDILRSMTTNKDAVTISRAG